LNENTTPENDFSEENEFENIPEPSPEFDGQLDPQNDKVEEPVGDEALVTTLNLLESPNDEGTKDENRAKVPLSPSEERTIATLAHLSVLLNLVTGFLGTIAALFIYLLYKDRSRLVAYHAMQAFIFQAITWFGAGILALILISFGTALFFLVVPLLCLIPGFILLLAVPASLIYGVVGAVQVNNGEDFRYWLVGDWVRDIIEPK
jgi:uncharacterized Tic20 family protein